MTEKANLPSRPHLSKTRVVACWKCPRYLWLKVYHPESDELQPSVADRDRMEQGINLTLAGYDDKQPVLLSRLLQAMSEPEWDQRRFDRVKARLLRDWRNLRKKWPIRQIFSEISPILADGKHPLKLAETLEPLSMDQLQVFVAGLFQQGQAICYAGGNFDQQTAEKMARLVAARLDVASLDEIDVVSKILSIPARTSPVEISTAIDHDDKAALLYIQGRKDNLNERAHLALLGEMIKAPFYNQLRTEKQLGYVVGYTPFNMNRVPGMALYVQSPVATPQQLQQEIEAFLQQFNGIVAEMNNEDLLRYQQSVLATIEEEPKNLHELSSRFLHSLDLGFRQFDLRKQMASAVRATTLPSLRKAYREVLGGNKQALWFLSEQKHSSGPRKPLNTMSMVRQIAPEEGRRYYIYK